MSTMETTGPLAEALLHTAAAKPFLLFRDHIRPAIEARRGELASMYAPVMGRPEINPVLLLGITLLQATERLSDRRALERCLFDIRWRMALGIADGWTGIHPSSLSYFRGRLSEHSGGKLALEAGLEAMRAAGYLANRRAVRIDSTHVLADLAAMSRLDCVRETLRLALMFLAAENGAEAWEPWLSRYAERDPEDLRKASVPHLRATMERAGADMRDVLARVALLGDTVAQAEPVRLLRRVFEEQFEPRSDLPPAPRPSAPAGAVQNPHDPDAQWSTKRSLGKAGWVGYKVQVCETAAESPRERREPTRAVVTAILTQPATASDHGSLERVLAAQAAEENPALETVFTDAGYISAPALERAEVQGYELCGPVGAPPHSSSRFGSDAFDVDLLLRRAICPAGKLSAQCARITEAGRTDAYFHFTWAASDCAACPLAPQCLSRKKVQPFRTLQVGEEHMRVQARRRLCRTPAYRMRMRRRSGIEGTISELKRGYGIRRCRYRGLPKTDLQMQFAGAACNLRRWAARLCWIARSSRPCTQKR
jgi:hypothetical protein